MTVSNHTIVALGILTRRAKKRFGTFKVSDIVNDSSVAFELLTKAMLSGDHELMSLATELNKTLKIEPNLINALDAYIHQLRSKNLNNGFILKRLACLSVLVKYLENVALDSASYRQATSRYLQEIEAIDYSFCTSLVRNFFPYWLNKDSVFPEGMQEPIFDFKTQSKDLIKVWGELKQTILTNADQLLLNHYISALKKINIQEDELDLRIKVAKLIILKQRDYEKTAQGYRANIDALKSYFSNDNLLDYFLSVAREFYSQWAASEMQDDTLALPSAMTH